MPFTKGHKGYWLGKKRGVFSEETKRKMGLSKFKNRGACLRSKHLWVERHFGKPSICEHCGKDKLKGCQIHWANKSGNYLYDRTDWLRLCAQCHWNYDLESRNLSRIFNKIIKINV